MSEKVVFFNGKFVPDSEARVPLLTHCLQYGTGVFEGIRAYYDEATGEVFMFRAQDHFSRMLHNVKFITIKVPYDVEKLTEIAAELIRLNRFASDVYVRPFAYKAAVKVGVALPPEDGFAMLAVPMGAYLDTRKGLHCEVSSWRRLQDNSIPCRGKICGAYVNSALAASEARERGFDEAIMLNEAGHVAEGSAMNIFLVRNGRLITPDVSQGILEGITRDSVMTIARELLNAETEARVVDRTELYIADEVFLCGTAAQVAPVTKIDGRSVGNGEIGPVTLSIQQEYDRIVRGRSPSHSHWLERVYGYAVANR